MLFIHFYCIIQEIKDLHFEESDMLLFQQAALKPVRVTFTGNVVKNSKYWWLYICKLILCKKPLSTR